MAIERTFSIIKPDATARNLTGAVNAVIEKAGLRIVAQKRIRMTKDPAEGLSPIVQLITGLSSLPVGSEATVIHVDGDGHYWADFGDTEEREFEVIE